MYRVNTQSVCNAVLVSPLYKATQEKYQGFFLLSVLLRAHSMSNNANGKKEWYFFPGIAWYCGDNDFTFGFIACSDTASVAFNA